MFLTFIKVLGLALLIAFIGELNKKSTLFAALIASIPITSVLTLMWMRYDEQSIQSIIEFCQSLLWMIFPSMIFFIVLPMCLSNGIRFLTSILIAAIATVLGYYGMLKIRNASVT